MRRRNFLATLAAAGIGSSTVPRSARALSGPTTSGSQIPELYVDSSSSLLDASYGELTDSSVVPVVLEDTAENVDEDGNGDAVIYSESTDIPVVATDGNVVGFGWRVVENGTNWQKGNEEFLLNVWDEHVGGGTVLYDEGHSQYYTLADHSEFESYAENNGYTVQATTSLASDLSGADAAWITSPGSSFTSSELQALSDFVANGGAVFLHDQSDYSDYDQTGNLNEIAGDLGLAYRFNDDQVIDEVVNYGANYEPLTDDFNTNFPYFSDRDGLGLDPTKTYVVDVTEVTDGDTADVEFSDGSTESVRILGLDTPETSSNSQYERVQEWEGIESNTYLENWADDATQFGKDEIGGKTVDLYFDSEEPVRDAFGRVLGYIDYDKNGDGSRDTNYNYQCVTQGYARIYDSGFSKHESFWQAENDARANGTRVWTESDPENTSEIRDRSVDDVFLPKAASVRTSSGAISDSRVPMYAETSATQDLDGGYAYSGDIPMAGVDEANRIGMVGSPFVDENYESGEGFAVDTSDYENYVFAINLADYLKADAKDGVVLVDGGHGQFNASYGLASEDTAWWMRYLEGQGVGLEGINELTASNLSRGRTLVVTTPEESFTTSEVDAISSFISDGGSVLLLGCGKVTSEARANMNDLASRLGTDLRVNEDQVLDDTNNVNSDSEIPDTTQFDTSFPLFDPYTSGTDTSVAVSTGSAADVTDTSATLNGSLDDLGGASSADCYFEYREVGASSWNTTATQTLSATGSFSDSVSGLTSGTDYEFRAVASASDGDSDTGTTASFTTSGGDTSVAVSTGSASDITDTSATLNGSLDDLGGASSADCYFEYRPVGADTWSSTTAQTLSSTGSYSDSVSGLSSGTDYEFRAAADASDGDSDVGTASTFTTNSGGTTGGEIAIDLINADAEGNDNDNLNDEYVVFENIGTGTLDLTGWSVQDEADKTYNFPDSFTLDPAAQVTLHTGSGTDTSTDLYWGRSGAVWNNSGDTVFVYDDGGSEVLSRTYSGGSGDSVEVSTGSASDVTDTSATLNGSLDDLGGASSADCYFEYRQVGADSWNSTAAQTLSATGSFSDSVSGLSTGVDYEFRARSVASDNYKDGGTTATFTTGGDASVAVSTGSASDVTETSATLNGSLDDLGGASSADCYFEYRQVGASSWTTTSAQTLSATGSFSDSVSGLSSATDYEFRAVADASDGDSDTGTTATFTTSGETALAVSTGSASDVTASSATLNGSLDDLGGASSADCYFEYRESGTSTWTATATQTLSATGSFSDSVSGLSEETDYEFRAVADASDGDSDTGTTATFTTGDDPAAVSTGSASDVTDSSATLNGSLDDLGGASSADCYFEYRQSGSSTWTATSAQTLSSTGSFSDSVSGLSSGTDYEFRALADAADGDSDTGTTATFTTTSTASDPVIDSYTVTEAGSPNPHAEITADWAVSDADGDLSTVLVEVFDSSGTRVDASQTSVSGSSASGSDFFKIKKARNQTFDVVLTVTDATDRTASATRTVTE